MQGSAFKNSIKPDLFLMASRGQTSGCQKRSDCLDVNEKILLIIVSVLFPYSRMFYGFKRYMTIAKKA